MTICVMRRYESKATGYRLSELEIYEIVSFSIFWVLSPSNTFSLKCNCADWAWEKNGCIRICEAWGKMSSTCKKWGRNLQRITTWVGRAWAHAWGRGPDVKFSLNKDKARAWLYLALSLGSKAIVWFSCLTLVKNLIRHQDVLLKYWMK